MGPIACMLGGIVGFLSFLISWLVFDFSLLAAFGLYLSTGFGVFALFCVAALLPFQSKTSNARTA